MNGYAGTSYIHPKSFETIDGVVYAPKVTKEFLADIKNLPVKEDDVFVVTFPKSGTTWLSEVLWQIYSDGKVDFQPIGERVMFLEFLSYETSKLRVDKFLNHRPRIFTTHLQYNKVPMGAGDKNKPKYIYVMRNPKDVAVSYYHHYSGCTKFQYDRSWDEFFKLYMDAKVVMGGWFDHVLGWWAHRHDSNILFLKYEDMKKDLPGAVQQIARFVGRELSPEIIQRIADQTTFTAMADGKGRFYDNDKDDKTRYHPDHKFIRKGNVGDWKSTFTEKQNKLFDEAYQARMAGSGLELEF